MTSEPVLATSTPSASRMREVQPSLTALVAALEQEQYKFEEVVGAYMATSRTSFSGRSLEKSVSKQYGVVTVTDLGAVTHGNSEILPYFDTLKDDQQRKILLFAVCSMCHFSIRARNRLFSIAIAFDQHLAKVSEEKP